MESKKPLLSICIPTYNRVDVLDKSMASIVAQPEFESGDVELVVSDNASNDNTEEVVKKYQEKYKNIFYSKNQENIRDKNFPVVIEKAHGVFRKLCNDTLIFKEGALKKMIDLVKDNIDGKPIIFFLNKTIKKKRQRYFATNKFDSFVKIVSFYSTGLAGFGIWEVDFNKITDKFSGCELSLWQTKVLLEMGSNKNKYLIENSKLFDTTKLESKNLSYGLYNVFYKNYLGLYEKYLMTHDISVQTFDFLHKDLLFGFFSPWITNVKYDFERYVLSENEDLYQLIFDAYKKENYFRFFLLKLRLLSIKKHIKRITRVLPKMTITHSFRIMQE
jgi:glycosyltransferase involved in cell wall biosynthesis